MKKYLIPTVAMAICLCNLSCDKKGVPVEFSNACNPANEKKYVEIAGFLDDGVGVFCSNIGGGRMECSFTLKENSSNEKGINVYLEEGSSSNEVEKLEKNYKKENIKIRANDGSLVRLEQRVKLTGEMNVTPDASTCFLKVTKIEK
jgi:hypothetical protein